MRNLIYTAAGVLSAALLWASWSAMVNIPFDEACGFVTGAWCVWLGVKQNIWNWPIGIANNVAFAILFWRKALYANVGLQAVFMLISLYGWYQWLFGGEKKTKLPVSRAGLLTNAVLAIVLVPATYGLALYLRSVGDSAPFLDALTTVLSLGAQFLLARKKIETWYVWIAVDVIYIGLLLSRDLRLAALLYVIFIVMCVTGAREWLANLRASGGQPAAETG